MPDTTPSNSPADAAAPDTLTPEAGGAPVVIVGGGPAGLMAAEVLVAAGLPVALYDAMPSVGRKFLLAGKGGLNLTHSEAKPQFAGRYGAQAPAVDGWLDTFSPQALRDWAQALGVDTFVGSSGRVFPTEMKAAPLLRAWLHRLRQSGVRFHMRHRWVPASLAPVNGVHTLEFDHPAGRSTVQARGVLLALGGGSWARLGSDGAWVAPLQAAGLDVAPLQAANCGFDAEWSPHLREKHAGAALKNVALCVADLDGAELFRRKGECVLTEGGLEGSLVYAASACIRDQIAARGPVTVHLDLLPDQPLDAVTQAIARGRGARSLANHLREQLSLSGVKAGLLREGVDAPTWSRHSGDAAWLAGRIKALPVTLTAPRPMDEAISTAGGVRLGALDAQLQVQAWPGVAVAGEMLDWEAPTGGYLLSACFASAVVAARGLAARLAGAPAEA
ncbi:MAG: aminoacetone oxidase family FAD-binding enzyme [Burkholderiales bacterium PBB6]|nr:MAG: aminoacetone oxidase family FAD-binding enzyme [Burkholderiales bacterium PBB6]